MSNEKLDVWVYAHWLDMKEPKCIGILSVHQGKGRKSFSFEYDADWIESQEQLLLDPEIGWYSGPQFPYEKENFGMFLDSMPDRWGRTLMKRRAALEARKKGINPPTLLDTDFLLGVFDRGRMGALRFKLDPNGPFLDNDQKQAIPPFSSVRELQNAANKFEQETEEGKIEKWLAVLMAPGSSLGGARPKANVLDETNHPWIAKFPSKNDTIDKGAWEFLAYELAKKAGIFMSLSSMEKIMGRYHTFFTKRFDRLNGERVHFASAMTMTGHNEETIKDAQPSYLELAEFIQFSGFEVEQNLQQLWRRIVFNIAISNTDDHLRNHGFLLNKKGWGLSPAFDINPSVEKGGLSLNISLEDNSLDFNLVRSVGPFFKLNDRKMDQILGEVKDAVSNWRKVATRIGIPRKEQELMAGAFRY